MSPLTPEKQAIVEGLMPSLRAIAHALCRGDEDAVSVAYLAAVKAVAVWENHGKRTDVEMFARQCARFAVMRYRKGQSNQRVAPIAGDVVDLNGVDVEPAFTRLLHELEPADRKFFHMKFCEGRSVVSISKCTRIKANKICTSLARSVDRLRELLEDMYP